MTAKKSLLLVLCLALAAPWAFSADSPAASSAPATVAFAPGDFYLSPQIVGVSAGTTGKIALGVNGEYFVTKTIAVGADVNVYPKSPGAVALFPDVEYHFDAHVQSLDLFIGGGPSVYFRFGTDSKTLFGVKGFGAARYFFDSHTGVFAKLGIGSTGSKVGGFGILGVSFKI